MEAAKSYREGLSKQERVQYFDKIKVKGGKDGSFGKNTIE